MPNWPGGPCPMCGEDMPENLIHCQSCRALLNPELQSDSVEIPSFIPLKEIESMVEVKARGHYVGCPKCGEELRINKKYIGERVICKFCDQRFEHVVSQSSKRLKAFFANCAHCEKELRAAPKYIGQRVLCKHCGGQIDFQA